MIEDTDDTTEYETEQVSEKEYVVRPKRRVEAPKGPRADKREEVKEAVSSIADVLDACNQNEAAAALRGAHETVNAVADKVEEVEPLLKRAWGKVGKLFEGTGPRPALGRTIPFGSKETKK